MVLELTGGYVFLGRLGPGFRGFQCWKTAATQLRIEYHPHGPEKDAVRRPGVFVLEKGLLVSFELGSFQPENSSWRPYGLKQHSRSRLILRPRGRASQWWKSSLTEIRTDPDM